jgi:hypothetical protein
MVEDQITTNDTGPADTSPDSGADIGSTMEAVYDAHNPDQESEPSEYVSNEPRRSADAALELQENPEDEPSEIESPPGSQMPLSWGKDREALWSNLDPQTQAFIAQRELEAQRRISELGRTAKHGDIGEAFEHYRAQGVIPLGENGEPLSAPEVLESALAFDRQLRTDPAAAITALANAHGVSLAALAGVQSEWEQTYGNLQQELQKQRAEIEQWQQQHAQYEQQLQQQRQQQYAAREQWMAGELEKFTSGKAYWSTIEDEVIRQVEVVRSMAPARLQSDPLSVLKEAEQRALRVMGVDPDEKSKLAEAKKKADQAKRLASMNVGRRGIAGKSAGSGSWEETLADTYDRIHNFGR